MQEKLKIHRENNSIKVVNELIEMNDSKEYNE